MNRKKWLFYNMLWQEAKVTYGRTWLGALVYFAAVSSANAGIFNDITDLLTAGMPPIQMVLCTILLMIIGDVGRGIATLSVMALGVGAMLGRVTWGQAITVASGIAIMFGAPLILPILLLDPLSPSFNIPCVPNWGNLR